MAPRTNDPKSSESVARLVITAGGAEAWLTAQSYKEDCDLVLEAKGDGKVRVDGSPVLTVDSLGDLDELAAVLACITIDGADPAAVLALDAALKATNDIVQGILDTFAGKPGGTVANLLQYIVAIDDTLSSLTDVAAVAKFSIEEFLNAVAGNPDPATITIASGGIVGLAIAAWNELVAQVAAGGGGGGGDLQPLLDLLAVKPGATIADVAAIWQAVSDTSTGFVQLLATLSGKPLALNPTIADVQAGLPILIKGVLDSAIGEMGLDALLSWFYSGDIIPQLEGLFGVDLSTPTEFRSTLVAALTADGFTFGGGEPLAQQILDAFGGTAAALSAYVTAMNGQGKLFLNFLAVLAGEDQPHPGEPDDDAALAYLDKIVTNVAAWNAGGGGGGSSGVIQAALDALAGQGKLVLNILAALA